MGFPNSIAGSVEPIREIEETSRLAVLVSGGLDSAILLGEVLQHYEDVVPLYVRSGFFWEPAELNHLRDFLDAIGSPVLRPLQVMEVPVRDLIPDHWAVTGRDVPDAESPDEAVYLPARNVWLLAKSLVWCHLEGVPTLALATLNANPFPDATPSFFETYQTAVNLAIGGSVRIVRPFGDLGKLDVMRMGTGLPLERTFSCIRPVDGQHCGDCNKCAERRRAFFDAGLVDMTFYHAAGPYVA